MSKDNRRPSDKLCVDREHRPTPRSSLRHRWACL